MTFPTESQTVIAGEVHPGKWVPEVEVENGKRRRYVVCTHCGDRFGPVKDIVRSVMTTDTVLLADES